ncbi:hypothetical protein BJ165DRAFT_1494194 [Panaeolus papilionaceus]|nr:hypothetical protein BJ165DRAFT_1494194 [Panaeolus papilionaceus]
MQNKTRSPDEIPSRRVLLCSELFRLMIGWVYAASFITLTPQKPLFRELTLSDTDVKNPGILRWNGLIRRYASTATTGTAGKKKTEDEDHWTPAPTTGRGGGMTANVDGAPRIPTKENPAIFAIYGRICVAAKSYQIYLLRAYDYYPNDPIVCLCLAIASIG